MLVKACPGPIHDMFKGYCSMNGKSISEGLIDLMIEALERGGGGSNPTFQAIVAEYRGLPAGKPAKKR